MKRILQGMLSVLVMVVFGWLCVKHGFAFDAWFHDGTSLNDDIAHRHFIISALSGLVCFIGFWGLLEAIYPKSSTEESDGHDDNSAMESYNKYVDNSLAEAVESQGRVI